jgi:2-haloacid dehalogenase
MKVILFDVNETLLDLSVLQTPFERIFGDPRVIREWFTLLLHSSLVSTLTGAYSEFGDLAAAALDDIAFREGIGLTPIARAEILDKMRKLPPHPEVPASLARLREAGFRLATLTNSSPQMIADQMVNSGLRDYFEMSLSVGDVRRFKPAIETYQMAAKRLGVDIEQIRMVAAHDWDISGALQAGCRGAFIRRGGRRYHPLYVKPDVVGDDLQEVADRILQVDTRLS